MSFNLKSHSGRHKMFIGSIAVLIVSALGISSSIAVHSINEHDQAKRLLHSGLDLLADGKIEEGLSTLESANSKSPYICHQMTSWGYNNESWDIGNLAPQIKLKKLEAIRFLRYDEPWADDERTKLLQELKELKSVIALKERALSPFYSNNNTEVPSLVSRTHDTELASLLWSQNKKAEAVAHIDRAVTLYPWNVETRELAQQIYKDQKEYDKLRLLERRNLTEEQLSELAIASTNYGDSNRAESIEKLGKFLIKQPWCVAALIVRSATHLDARQTKQAIDDANKVLALYPGLAEGYYRRARAYEELNEPAKAFADYEAALKSMPYSKELIANKTNQAKSLKLYNQVLQAQNDAIKLAPREFELYKDKAEYLQSINRYKEAEAVVDEAIPLARMRQRCRKLLAFNQYESDDIDCNGGNKSIIDLQILKAQLRWSQDDKDGAIKTLDALIAKLPKNISLRNKKTDYLFDAKKFDLALASINETIALQEPSILVPFIPPLSFTKSVEDGSDLYQLPPCGQVSYDAKQHLEKRIEIYAALNDRTKELKDRHSLLQLKRLSLTSSDNLSEYLHVMQEAIKLPDRAVALNVAERMCKATGEPLKANDVDYFCRSIKDTENSALAIEVINKIENGLKTKFVSLGDTRAKLQSRGSVVETN